MHAMVLCAGHGTRLRPLTLELPKPLVPIGDRPLLAHILDELMAQGAERILVNTHHLPEKFKVITSNYAQILEVIHEPEIRGTAGGVAGARERLGPGPVVVWNGDILAHAPLSELVTHAGDDLALLVAPCNIGEGTVGVDAGGRIVRLRGERFGVEAQGGDYVGIAALGPRALAALPERGCLVGDVALPTLRRGDAVAALVRPLDWCDVGSTARYHRANLRWLEQRRLEHWIAATASVAPGVELSRCVVGAGARVAGQGALRGVVAWPGSEVSAPLSDAIVTQQHQVTVGS